MRSLALYVGCIWITLHKVLWLAGSIPLSKHDTHYDSGIWLCLWCLMPLSTNVQQTVILWQLILLVEDTGVPGQSHRHTVSYRQTWSHNVVSIHRAMSGIRTHNVSGDSFRIKLPVLQHDMWYICIIFWYDILLHHIWIKQFQPRHFWLKCQYHTRTWAFITTCVWSIDFVSF